MNKAMSNLIGKPFDEIIGRTCWEMVHGTSEPIPGCPIMRMKESLKRETMTLPINSRWFEVTADPIFDKYRKLSGAVHILTDITERKQAEEALKKSELRFRNCFDLPLIGFAITSPEKGWIEVNDRICSTLGYSRDEIVRKTWSELTHPDDLAADTEQFNLVLSGQIEKYSMDKRFIRKDGEVVWTSISVGCVRKPDGRVDYIIGLMENITERKKTEEALQKSYEEILLRQASMLNISEDLLKEVEEREKTEVTLRESEEKYRKLFETELDAIMVFDGETKQFIDVNEAAIQLYGYDKEEFLRMKQTDITAEVEASDDSIKKALAGELKKISLRYHKKKDGTVFPVEIMVGTFKMKDRKVLFGVIRDITEQKKAEERLREYHERLRHLASQMSLIEEQERRRIANILHDSIGQNLALSKIKLEELQEFNTSESFSASLNKLRETIDQAINSTRSLTFDISPPVLYELGFEAAIEWLGEQMLKQHKIIFEFRDDRNPKPLSETTKVLLFQAVKEFLINIIKHSKAHNVRVSSQKDENNILICIEDDGIGFDLTSISTKIMETSSFGLFSVRERLTMIGGTYEINSVPGKGTQIGLIAPLENP